MRVLGRRHATPNSKKADHVKWWANWVILYDGVLYKQSYSWLLLRCMTPEIGKKILEKLHERMCSSHIGGHALVVRTIRTDYYWRSLRKDATNLVRTCEKY